MCLCVCVRVHTCRCVYASINPKYTGPGPATHIYIYIYIHTYIYISDHIILVFLFYASEFICFIFRPPTDQRSHHAATPKPEALRRAQSR